MSRRQGSAGGAASSTFESRRNGPTGGATSSTSGRKRNGGTATSTFGNGSAVETPSSSFNNGGTSTWSFEQQLMQNLGQSQGIPQPQTLAPIQPNLNDNSTATALDAMFGHSNFSRAMQTAQSTPASQLTTPFYELLMQNLSHQPTYQQPPPPNQQRQQSYVQATPQQTRSGRISRPPVAPLAQSDLMRVMGLLSGPGMEPVRAAMEASGLLDGYNLQQQQQQQQQRQEEEEGQRQNAMTQALQMLLAAQSMGGQSQSQNYAQPMDGNGGTGELDTQKKGKKRGRRDDQPQPPTRDNSSTASPDSSNLPAPTKGKGSRLALPKEDIINRRKERNKASAQASRMRKQTALEMSEEKVKVKEEEVKVLSEKCERLERELEDMRQLIHNSGIHIPTPQDQSRAQTPRLQSNSPNPNLSTAIIPPTPSTNNPTLDPNIFPFPFPFNFNYPSFPDTSNPPIDSNGLGAEGNGDIPFDFNMFMNMDSIEDEEADGDFQPETSPLRGSDTDGERDEGEEDITPNSKRQRRNSKSSKSQTKSKSTSNETRPSQTPDENRLYDLNTPAESIPGNEEEEFIDPEMEDEDLFLPIEDVPIPPSESSSDSQRVGTGDVTGDMMKALKVDTRDQLAAVMQKLVDSAAEGGGLAGVGPDVVEKLKSVIMMAQAQRAAEKGGNQSRDEDEEEDDDGDEEEED